MCQCDDYDSPSVYNESNPVAKKEHKCSECRRSIEIGERYCRVEGCWDGDWHTFKTCRHCVAMADVMRSISECFCPSMGNMLVDFFDDDRDGHGSLPARLYHSARRKWRHRRGARKGQLMPVPVVPESCLKD